MRIPHFTLNTQGRPIQEFDHRIHAFADGERSGNPAYVIASTESAAARQSELIALARAQGCEVTHTERLLLQPTEDGLWFVGGYCRHIV